MGIKINSADFQRGGFTEEESMEVVQILSREGMDLIEISGGTYEKPAMVKGNRNKVQLNVKLIFRLYQKTRQITDKPLMLTVDFVR